MTTWRGLKGLVLTPQIAVPAAAVVLAYGGALVLDDLREQMIWVVGVGSAMIITLLLFSLFARRINRAVAVSLLAELPYLPESRVKVTLANDGRVSEAAMLQILATSLDMVRRLPVSGGSVVSSISLLTEGDRSES